MQGDLFQVKPLNIRDKVETMSPDAAKDRIAFLVPELRRHNWLYHIKGEAEIDDRQYDLLYRELELLEDRFLSGFGELTHTNCGSAARRVLIAVSSPYAHAFVGKCLQRAGGS